MIASQSSAQDDDFPVAIVGTGFSGLAMAVLLRQAGIRSFTLFEKADEVGGTWRENGYPGAACDIPSHLYSFSFEPNPGWTRTYPRQPEILAYLKRCADKYGITPHIRFRAEVTGADFDEATGTWTVQTGDGQRNRARALVLGNGALHVPAYPDIPGLERFAGARFHSACWDHGYDLSGKRVAVIGTGASAIQFVPEIAPRVARLHLFQRTPPWILPHPDRPLARAERWLLDRVPALQRAYRAAIYCQHEWRAAGFVVDTRILRAVEGVARWHLRRSIPDPALRAALTPSYRMGCKRILISNDFYPALLRDNVELVTAAIESVGPDHVRTADGARREVDAIILGTGFSPTRYLSRMAIRGLGGRELNAVWRDAPEAYLGITVTGFPNLFLLMGPNTGLGHNSMVFMIEAQARYALQCMKAMRARRLLFMDVLPEVQAAFNAAIREKLRRTVWATGCRSWYQTPDGRNPTLWPGFTVDYWLRTRRVKFDHYALRAA